TRRTHGNEGYLRVPHRLGGVRGGTEAAGGNHLLHQLSNAFLHNGGLAGIDELHLCGAHVHSDHRVAFLREAGSGNTAHVSKTEDANLAHSLSLEWFDEAEAAIAGT